MPNSANRSNSGGGNSNKGQPKHRTSRSSSDKPNPERSDLKHGNSDNGRKGDPGRTSNEGRKRASGGSANE
ncbi:MAG TPA: hypothetical protein VGN63_04590 [Flavisolibacter sp.]|jgi:hypothetical protein|nr:hypothetical protein [Flavisolibacter sp.]